VARIAGKNTPSEYTILVVDDDTQLLEGTARLLRFEGHEVMTANSGRKALEMLRSHSFHLVVLDYFMPGLNGEETVRAIREFNTEVQIVLQTGQSERPARELLHDLEIQGYHDKSEGPDKLLLWVDVALKAHSAAQARRTLEGSLKVIGLALEARDLETIGHIDRVVRYALALGRSLGFAGRKLEGLQQGAYLHDLGKLAIPDAILLKPGKLEPDEWIVMKEHAERGYNLAKLIPGLSPVALEVIRHHHERFDGMGYPNGLMGEGIPLEARIFAVCDVYDALCSKRPYKSAWTQDQALDEIRSQRGKHFDPMVVDAFIDVMAAIDRDLISLPEGSISDLVSLEGLR
jgi:response regulator RpfG family c-di-GMP phosphodiesterase